MGSRRLSIGGQASVRLRRGCVWRGAASCSAKTAGAANAEFGREEVSALERAARSYVVAHLDLGQRDVFAMLAERGVFVDRDGLRCVVGALDDDVGSIDGLHDARGPGFAEVGARLLVLLLVNDHDEDGAYGSGLGVFVTDGGDHVSGVEVADFDLIALFTEAGIGPVATV